MGRLLSRWLILVFCVAGTLSATTRFSAVHSVPDAHGIAQGQFIINAEGYFFQDSLYGATANIPYLSLTTAFSDLVSCDIAFANGFSMGFKGRLLSESGDFIPSVVLGAQNLFHSKEDFFSLVTRDTLPDSTPPTNHANQYYLALGRSFNELRLQVHAGILSTPALKYEVVNYFGALEWYFGMGLYTTFEFYTTNRGREFVPSFFLTEKLINKRLEIAVGFVALDKLLYHNQQFGFDLASTSTTKGEIRPGIWFGVRYLGDFSWLGSKPMPSLEDQVRLQSERIDKLETLIDTTRIKLAIATPAAGAVTPQEYSAQKKAETGSVAVSGPVDPMKSLVFEKMVTIRSLYKTDPFDPVKIGQLKTEVRGYGTRVVPALVELLVNKKEDPDIRRGCAAMLGDMGDKSVSGTLISVLAEDRDPQLRIEILIALGKLKETQAVYLIKQLANDQDLAVAQTAKDVFNKIKRETGYDVLTDVPDEKK